ncbi:MAG: response regulator [Syntrophales bacterium]|nr:response regulator [Syntrophales bacterium]
MPKAKILIVEDETIVARDIQKSVETMGYFVCAIASSGEEAVQKASETRPDLVLMDIVLKGDMDGIRAAEQINALFKIPIVYLTAYDDENILQRAKITTPYGYITKPFDDRALRIAIEIALYKNQAEVRIRKTELWLAAVLRSVGDAVIASDRVGRITFMNQMAEKLTGRKQEEVLGKKLTEVLDIKDEKLSGLEKHLVEKVITQGLIINLLEDHLLVAKDGTVIPVSDSLAPIRDDDGETAGTVLVFRDITESKRMEEELQHGIDRLRKALGATVQSMASVVETRDPYTAGHQRHVADLARTIATEMGLTADQIEGIRTASTIHDIGKISVPAEILSKPTKLSGIEFGLIKVHSQSGYDILKDIDFPWPVSRMVLEHHERMDGSGYPQGLPGDKLLIESRIIAVADVVEAMASHRPYRPGLGIDAALEEIEKNRGVLYDNTVADACLRLFREKGFQIT